MSIAPIYSTWKIQYLRASRDSIHHYSQSPLIIIQLFDTLSSLISYLLSHFIVPLSHLILSYPFFQVLILSSLHLDYISIIQVIPSSLSILTQISFYSILFHSIISPQSPIQLLLTMFIFDILLILSTNYSQSPKSNPQSTNYSQELSTHSLPTTHCLPFYPLEPTTHNLPTPLEPSTHFIDTHTQD